MTKEMIISTNGHETMVAILEDDLAAEIFVERERQRGVVGNVYKGRVSKVLPGMQSSFIDVGLERDGFLYVAEVIDTMAMTEAEVQDQQGRWYRMQIRPYKNTDNKIDGAILSLVDIDALKLVSTGVNAMRSPDRAFIVVTHYQRLLNYIVPDYVHVLSGGRIVKSGGKELALELEEKGYGWIEASLATA